MDWIVSILLFIVSIGLLICLHELGHFTMAKIFNVYCYEFSIGFGPALFHKRKKGKETYFSIRAIPLGGYVSMYGEEDQQIEEGVKIDESRSIEGIKKWKKAIVVSAGIIVNALLAVVIFGVKNLCFPQIAATRNMNIIEDSPAYVMDLKNDDKIKYIYDESGSNQQFYYEYRDSQGVINAGYFFIVDNDVEFNDGHYVLTFDYYTTKEANNFSKGLTLFASISKDEILKEDSENDTDLRNMYLSWARQDSSPNYYPNVKKPYLFDEIVNFDVNLKVENNGEIRNVTIPMEASKDGFKDIGILLRIEDYWPSFNERFNQIWVDFGDSATAVFDGLKILFTKGGIKNMSGVVGIFTTSKNLYSNYTFATYLQFWGLISVNLAIFNLLPFPALDGWQLLVTIVEGITRKKISTKFKAIMNMIGFVLLILLMVAILVVDVGRLI